MVFFETIEARLARKGTVQKASVISFMETEEDSALRAAIAALSASSTADRTVLSLRLGRLAGASRIVINEIVLSPHSVME